MKYFCDKNRHIVCKPYSIENLHKMAKDLGIKKWWFHNNHYDMPKKRIKEITNKCILVSSKEIVNIIKMRASVKDIIQCWEKGGVPTVGAYLNEAVVFEDTWAEKIKNLIKEGNINSVNEEIKLVSFNIDLKNKLYKKPKNGSTRNT